MHGEGYPSLGTRTFGTFGHDRAHVPGSSQKAGRVQLPQIGSGRYGRIVVAAAVLASVLVIAVGGGYSASKALLADSVAFAVDGAGLDRLNAATTTPDAEILNLAKGTGRIRTVHRDGQLYVVDTATNSVTRVDPGTLEVGPSTPPRPGSGPDKVTVVAGGGTSALIDRGSDTVQRLDRDTLAPAGDPIAIEGGVATAVVDAGGVIWVATREAGTIVRIGPDGQAQPVPVAVQGVALTVALVGGLPVAVDVEAGVVVAIDPKSLKRSERARLAQPPAGGLLASAFDAPAPYLWLLDQAANALLRVDLRNRKVDGPTIIGAGEISWGQPLIQGARVYAPNLGDHTLVAVDVNTLQRVDEVAVPGVGPDFDATIEGGALWANDPTTGTAVVVDQQGVARKVGKGNGEGRLPDKADKPDKPDQAANAQPPGNAQPPASQPASKAPTVAATKPAPSVTTPVAPPKVVAPGADPIVPDLTGLTRDAACAALSQVKLGCQSTEQDGGKVGKVASQAPKAGAALRPATAVNIVLGLGVKVPKLQGSSRDVACSDLKALKLQCIGQAVTLEPKKTKNEVFEQQPSEGDRVDEGTSVTVRYWGDPSNLPVPDVKGDAPTVACDKVKAAGFFECRPDSVKTQPAPRPPPNTVIGQDPAAGATAAADKLIVVTVYAPDPVAVPAPAAGDDYTTYCASLQAKLLTCTAGTTPDAGPFVGAIAAINPVAATKLYPGDPVTITSHTRTAVPNVVGSAPDAACAALAAQRLTCSRDNRGAAPNDATPLNQVVAQSIAPGQPSDASNAVGVGYYTSPYVPPLPPPPVPMYLIGHNSLPSVYSLAFDCGVPGWTCVGQVGTWWPYSGNVPPAPGQLVPVNKCYDAETGVHLFTVSSACATDARFENKQGPVAWVYNGPSTGRGGVQRVCRDDLGPRRYLWSNSGTPSGWKGCGEWWYVP